MSDKAPSWIGKILNGRYRIDERLGRGGMSTVFKAFDPNLQRPVAIKIIHPHLTDDREFTRRFKQEAAAVAQLRHNNIVQVHDFNKHADFHYMVLEFLSGQTLARKLTDLNQAGMRLPLAKTIRIMATLCDAVDYAHQRRMIHRDLKPANIMIDLLEEPILMDFGIAKIIGGNVHTATGAAIGTAAYMSPEQVRSEEIDHRADIYSLGIILYEMLSGEPPYQGDSTLQVMMKHVNEPIPDIRLVNANTPHTLVAIVERALAKDPDLRFQTAAEMATALRTTAVHVQSPSDTLAARHLDRLSALWQEANDLLDERKFAAVLDKLDELKRADPDYKPDKVAQLRIEALRRLFGQAERLHQSGKLNESLQALETLHRYAPAYPQLEKLEQSVRRGLQHQEQQARLENLYAEANHHLDNHQYQQALEKWDAIQLEPGGESFPDRLQIEKRARQGMASDQYTAALQALANGKTRQALALWQQVQELDPDFPDRQQLAARAKEQQEAQERKQKLLLRLGGIGGGVIILSILGFFIFGNRGKDVEAAIAMTETAVAAAILPTDTPVPTETAVPPTDTPTPTATPLPSDTPTPTATNTPPPTDTPVPSPTTDSRATALQNSSLFTAPDAEAAEVGLLREGEKAEVIGRSANNSWLYVRNPAGEEGFVFGERVSWTGDVEELPVKQGTAVTSPTNTPGSGGGSEPLVLNLWGLPGAIQCGDGRSWSEQIFIEGEGGNGVYTYYWNGERIQAPTGDSITFLVQSDGGPIIGAGRVVSGDGQSREQELFLARPDQCD